MRRRIKIVAAGLVGAGLVAGGPWGWTEVAASGHEYDAAEAPAADVVIVLGGEVAADRRTPSARLAGRLETGAELVKSGRAKVILVSGDGNGESGDEPAVMTGHLTGLGVDPRRIVRDPYGLDTYDSCVRARDVYGLRRALIVSQSYHLSRAVALCRDAGVDVDGVRAACAGCSSWLLARKGLRDVAACTKAAWDAATGREPAVGSPATGELQEALAS